MSRHRHTHAVPVAVAPGAILASTAGARPADAQHGTRVRSAQGSRPDPRTPDQRDRAEGRRIVASTPVKVVELRQVPAEGFDVADAAVGAAGMLGVVLLAPSGAKLVAHPRREPADLLPARPAPGPPPEGSEGAAPAGGGGGMLGFSLPAAGGAKPAAPGRREPAAPPPACPAARQPPISAARGVTPRHGRSAPLRTR